MSRFSKAVVVLSLSALLVSASASAESLPPREAIKNAGVKVHILREDRVSMGCGMSGGSGATGALAWSVDADDGTHLQDQTDVINNRGWHVVLSAGATSIDPAPGLNAKNENARWSWFRIPRHIKSATLRVAWASWVTDDIDCSVWVNGVKANASDLPSGYAWYAAPTDFQGGAGAAAEHPLIGYGAAAVNQSLERTLEGRVNVHFDSGGYGPIFFEARGPEGQVHGNDGTLVGTSSLSFSEQTNGEWSFLLDGVGFPQQPTKLLYMLRLPD